MRNTCPTRGRPSRLKSQDLRLKALFMRALGNWGLSNADIAVRMGISVQVEHLSSDGGIITVHKWKETLHTAILPHRTRRRSRTVERYLSDAKATLPDYMAEATSELIGLKKEVTRALSLYRKACQLGLPTNDLLHTMRPVFDRWEQLGKAALIVVGGPSQDACPSEEPWLSIDALLDAVSVDDLYSAMTGPET